MNIELLGLLVRLAQIIPPLLKIASDLREELSDHEPLKKQILDLSDAVDTATKEVRAALK